jgi:hypothetical protein
MGRDSTGFGWQLLALNFKLRAKNDELTADR